VTLRLLPGDVVAELRCRRGRCGVPLLSAAAGIRDGAAATMPRLREVQARKAAADTRSNTPSDRGDTMPRSSLLRPVRCVPRLTPAALALLALSLAAVALLLLAAAPARADDPATDASAAWAGAPTRTTGPAPAVTAGEPLSAALAEPLGTPGLVLPQMADLRELSWAGAFAELHVKLQREYAFGDWKHIDWPALYARYAPRIARAQWAGNTVAYYLTLRRYAAELRDGHVSVNPDTEADQAVVDKAFARADGGFGLVPARLENGHVVAAWVQPGGPAARAGVKTGARLLRWRGRPIRAALAAVDTALGPTCPTDKRLDRERLRFLVRARVGAHRTLVFRNRGARKARTARLTAVADDRLTLTMTDERSTLITDGWPEKVVTHQILPGNIGYVRIRFELDLPAELPGDHTPTLEQFRQAIHAFVAADVNGVVVDVRRNSGGSDRMVAEMMNSFYGKRSFYEYADWFNTATGLWEIWDLDESTGEPLAPNVGVWIEPGRERYEGPVVALVDNACVSSGEGIALGIRRMTNGKTVGFHGTNGSFGMVGDVALLPGGFHVKWPYGSSLNADKVVQLDSRPTRRGWRGGVAPEVRVPATLRNVSRALRGHDVVLEYGLRELARMAD
jgi:carboxyl-terminal processing protease